jgi:hypothetical protein
MTEGQTGWLFLLLLSIFFIIIGIQGNLGVSFAILFCPKYVLIGSEQDASLPGTPVTPGGPNGGPFEALQYQYR